MKEKIKKIIIIIISVFFLFFIFTKKEEQKISVKAKTTNISVIIEKEDGNIKSDKFPNRDDYQYDKIECKNDNDTNITPTFNEESWKLKLKVKTSSNIDGNFFCSIYFKEIKDRKPSLNSFAEYIISNNIDGITKIYHSTTPMMKQNTEYRFVGKDTIIKNYVLFNDELWRIVGVFDTENESGKISKRVKIVRSISIGKFSYDTSPNNINSGFGVNEWSNSYIAKLLNPGFNGVNASLYYNRSYGQCMLSTNNTIGNCDFSSTGLTSSSKSYIEKVKWYTSGSNASTSSEMYKKERSENNLCDIQSCTDGISRKSYWFGEVGLIYASDYAYASPCSDKLSASSYNTSECDSWLKTGNSYNVLTANSTGTASCLLVHDSDIGEQYKGYLQSDGCANQRDKFPTVYLKENVKRISGSGSKSEPFIISLN